jgi:hypothetical protein
MENWFELPNDELLNHLKEVWYLKSPKLIGQLVKRGNFYFFVDIRSNEFRKVEYPENPYCQEIEILFNPDENFELHENSYYEFYIGIRELEKRINKNRLSILYVSKKNIHELTPKPFIERRNKVYTGINIELADTIRKAIKTLTSDINREPETFIYELLQNADDYKDPKKKNVEVKFTLTANYLLLTHNGQPFNFQNVYALTGISQGDKRENIETIGFKGIGFKSIFKDSNFAIVKSGGFEFKFDENCFTKAAKRPWQIIPVWVDNYDEELTSNADFLSAPVSIAIKPILGNEKLREIDKSYKNILSKVFRDDRILIFLRWIEKVIITDNLENDSKIELNKSKEKWFISSGIKDIEVEESIRNWLNKQIADEEITIPEKYQNIHKTKITFAVERNGSKLSGTTNSKIYNYLPTEIDFGFKFLINGDFIPDGSRTELHNNDWNNYLGKITGEKFVEWLSVLGNNKWIDYKGNSKQFDKDFINLLPDFQDPKSLSAGRNTFFLDSFKVGFKLAVQGDNSINFIPTQSGTLEALANIMVDETGLAEMLPDGFAKLTTLTHKLIHKDVGEGLSKVKLLISEYGKGVIYTAKNLQENIGEKDFQEWLKNTDNNFKFIKHLFNSDNEELKALLNSEKIILSQTGELCSAVELFSSIPAELNFIASNKINQVVKLALEKAKIELNLKPFNAIEFYNANLKTINTFFINENNNLNYWHFIYDNWISFKEDDEIKKSLYQLFILCKPIQEGVLNMKTVSSAYVPKEFAKEDEVETIIATLNLTGKYFIESKFSSAKRPDIKKWNEILKSSRAKSGLKDVITELITQLPTLDDSLHFKACIEIFKYWKANKEKPETQLTEIQKTTIQQTLKLKCAEGYYKANQCIVSEYYSADERINKIMPSIILKNQISSEYQPNQTFVSEWKQFFSFIGCKDLNSEQIIFNYKVDYFIVNQDSVQTNHFAIMQDFDLLLQANQKVEVPITFDFANKFAKIKLQTAIQNVWATPNEIHFSTDYTPELELQSDSEIQSQFKFLSLSYLANTISKDFLIKLGVHNNFCFINITPTTFSFYPSLLLTNNKYTSKFWKFIIDSEIHLRQFCSSNILNTIKTNNSIEVSENVFKKPTELFSKTLSAYVEDKSLIPLLDFSKYFTDDKRTVTLEQLIGINQELSINQCLVLLKKSNGLTQNEVSSLKIVNIIQRNQITAESIIGIKLPNTTYNWLSNAEIYFSKDAEIISQHPNNLLHPDFNIVYSKVGVTKISLSDYKTTYAATENSNAENEIKTKFNSRAEYVSFVITNGEARYSTVAEQLKTFINKQNYIECDDLYDTIEHGSLIWKRDRKFLDANSKIYFTDELTSKKSEIRKYLFKCVLQQGKVTEKIFHRFVFDETEIEIIQELNKTYDIPEKWLNKIQEIENQFRKEVEQFIESLLEVEDIYDEEKVQELKSILADFKNQPDEKRKTFNLLAKLKLCKRIGLSYDSNWEFNKVDNGNERYFIHSARGSFAYIHPNELLQMRDEGFKMAIDFGTNDIRIYNSPSEIIELYKNYLMLYQGKPSEEDILNLCEDTQDKAKFHFLIVDREKQTNDALAILKILNTDSYE